MAVVPVCQRLGAGGADPVDVGLCARFARLLEFGGCIRIP